MFKLKWIHDETKAEVDGGQFETEHKARAALPAFLEELLRLAHPYILRSEVVLEGYLVIEHQTNVNFKRQIYKTPIDRDFTIPATMDRDRGGGH